MKKNDNKFPRIKSTKKYSSKEKMKKSFHSANKENGFKINISIDGKNSLL